MRKLFLSFLMALCLFSLVGCSKEPQANVDKEVMDAFNAAEIDAVVTVKGYVAAKQSWWSNKATIYLLDNNSNGYFIYELSCTEEQYNSDLAIGNYVEVTGVKGAYHGEVEVMGQSGEGATYKVLSGKKTDFTPISCKANELVAGLVNSYVTVSNLEVVSVDLAKAETGGDLYVTVKDDTAEFTFCIESYLTDSSTDVYKTASSLVAGDKIAITGFLYWYDGPNPHVVAISK